MRKRFWAILLALVLTSVVELAAQKVEVKGKSSTWTKIGTVGKNTTFKVEADGIVDFGGAGHNDSPGAGVTGVGATFKSMAKLLGPALWALSGDIKGLMTTLAQPINSLLNYQFLHESISKSYTPAYDQGGIWIRITDSTGNTPIPTNLWYYWKNLVNHEKVGGIRFTDSDVTVWAKAHDGGSNPESTSSYGDNSGHYDVWIVKNNVATLLNIGKATALVPYKIAVTTAAVDGAGTDANVYIKLFGEKAETAKTYLDNRSDNFEKGKTDTFEINYPGDLGAIRTITVGHDNTGDKAGWYLNYVVVTNTKTNTSWTFICKQWLATSEGDGRIERTLKL